LEKKLALDDKEFRFAQATAAARFLDDTGASVPLLSGGRGDCLVVVAAVPLCVVLVAVDEEVAVESDGGLDGVEVAGTGLVGDDVIDGAKDQR
jgi:hypothetical protein